MILRFALIAICSVACLAGARAADLGPPAPQPAPLVQASGWQFQVTAYGWATSLDGHVGVGRLPSAKVDASFADILQKLDGAFMGSVIAHDDRFIVGLDLIWSKISEKVDLEGGTGPLAPFRTGAFVRYEQSQAIASGYAGMRLPIGTPKLDVYAIGGLRYQHLHAKLDLRQEVVGYSRVTTKSADWVDPVVGVAFNYAIDEKWFVHGLADVGGFDLGSRLTAQGLLSVGYHWTPSLSSSIGYRALYTDYRKTGENGGSFRYETTMHGPIASLSYHF